MSVSARRAISDSRRALLGFIFGIVIMLVVVQVFLVSSFDVNNMQRGVQALFNGVNPWAPQSRLIHFYNPPFAVVFLWPLLFTSAKAWLVLGGALLVALIFYTRAWVGAAWFATNTFTWMIAAGGIDMAVIGAGVLLLMASDRQKRWPQLALRVVAYGLLLVKPQGGLFIVVLYVLLRRDWRGVLASAAIYGLLFAPLYPDWLRVVLTDPPLAQTEASHSLWARFGPIVAVPIAALIIPARRWSYWQLGGALSGVLAPYGMPGVPIFLTLTAVRGWLAIPAVIIYSGCLAVLTWIAAESPLLGIYHLGMLGLALILACLLPNAPCRADEIVIGDRLKRMSARLIRIG